ncbi:sel1 repeat family protein [Buttiauxella izardii]|uniref:Sel1 repeat family protein n=2 Tax=Buttiauxella izardii TaxID=82991 RepID=A0A3A5JW14_9ENTR|nr:sel1 repeat family protein [Buttiauxella izardii]
MGGCHIKGCTGRRRYFILLILSTSFVSYADVIIGGVNMSKKSGGQFFTSNETLSEKDNIEARDTTTTEPEAAQKKEELLSSEPRNEIENAATDSKEKLATLKVRAEAGDSDAAYQLAVIFHKGISVAVNYSQAIYFYKLAAAGGSYQARKMMSLILSGPKDKQGNVTAQWMQLIANSIPVNSKIAEVTSEAPNASK